MPESERPNGDCGYGVGGQECISKLQHRTCPSKCSCCVTGMKVRLIKVIILGGKLFVNREKVSFLPG